LPVAAYAQDTGWAGLAGAGGGAAPAVPAIVVPPVTRPSAAALEILSAAAASTGGAAEDSTTAAVADATGMDVTMVQLSTAEGTTAATATSSGGGGALDESDISSNASLAPLPLARRQRRPPAARPPGPTAASGAGREVGIFARLRAAGADAVAASNATRVGGLVLLLASLGLLAFAFLSRRPAPAARSPAAWRARRGARGANPGRLVSRDAARLEARLRSRGAR